MIVVSDASPIIALAAVGHLELLRKLYGTILLPSAVPAEIKSAAAELAQATWIQSAEVRDRSLVQALTIELDLGEAEAIALAVESHADLLLMDERRGRAVARRLGCRVIGVLGVLIEAKNRGEVQAVRPLLDALRIRAGFRVDDALYTRVLQVTGES